MIDRRKQLQNWSDGTCPTKQVVVVVKFGGGSARGLCPTICIVGTAQTGLTSPCSGEREQLIEGGDGEPSYLATLQASGGKSPYTYTVSSGSLPPGLTLTSNTITGMATLAGTYNFTITAEDSNGCTGDQDFSILIQAN